MNVCDICGIPSDAGFFDDSSVQDAPQTLGEEKVLARYELPQGYCGMLMYFSQFAEPSEGDPNPDEAEGGPRVNVERGEVSPAGFGSRIREVIATPGYEWQIRCSGRPRYPYLGFEHIVNPWGLSGFPIFLRLEEACVLELVIRNRTGTAALKQVAGRVLGRYWYNPTYGGRRADCKVHAEQGQLR